MDSIRAAQLVTACHGYHLISVQNTVHNYCLYEPGPRMSPSLQRLEYPQCNTFYLLTAGPVKQFFCPPRLSAGVFPMHLRLCHSVGRHVQLSSRRVSHLSPLCFERAHSRGFAGSTASSAAAAFSALAGSPEFGELFSMTPPAAGMLQFYRWPSRARVRVYFSMEAPPSQHVAVRFPLQAFTPATSASAM